MKPIDELGNVFRSSILLSLRRQSNLYRRASKQNLSTHSRLSHIVDLSRDFLPSWRNIRSRLLRASNATGIIIHLTAPASFLGPATARLQVSENEAVHFSCLAEQRGRCLPRMLPVCKGGDAWKEECRAISDQTAVVCVWVAESVFHEVQCVRHQN